MMKKIVTVLTAFMLIFTAGSFIGVNHVDAKGYKSGKKSYTPPSGQTDKSKFGGTKSDSNVNVKKTSPDSKTKATNTAPKKSKSGLMKGLLLGGLGGLLLGSLFANMGVLGSILAFMVNMLVMVGIIMIAIRIFKYFKNKRKKQVEEAAWRQ
ncbi:hypothetical protein [Bacillus manliponensis]|uniref:hypothetical protein n=1 Tax=Bacillus manliponensis TaxID=574376 RepID=UPI0035176CEF